MINQLQELQKSERLAVFKFPPSSRQDHRSAVEEFEKIMKKFIPFMEAAKKSAMEIQDPLLRSIHMKEEQAKFIRLVDFWEANHKTKWWKINPYVFRNTFRDILNPKTEDNE